MRKFRGQSGQTLLEALIALALLTIILSAVSVAVLTSLSNSSFIKQQNQANKLGQQGIEFLRDKIVNGQVTSIDGGSIYNETNYGSRCLDANNVLKTFVCDPATPTDLIFGTFKREASFTPNNCGTGTTSSLPNGVQIAVTVSWTSGKCASSSYCNTYTVRSCVIDPNKSFPTPIPTIYQGV